MAAESCLHIEAITEIKLASRRVCQECFKIGAAWVHLRTCQTCGATLCCDSSPNRHGPNTRSPFGIQSSHQQSQASVGCIVIPMTPLRKLIKLF